MATRLQGVSSRGRVTSHHRVITDECRRRRAESGSPEPPVDEGGEVGPANEAGLRCSWKVQQRVVPPVEQTRAESELKSQGGRVQLSDQNGPGAAPRRSKGQSGSAGEGIS